MASFEGGVSHSALQGYKPIDEGCPYSPFTLFRSFVRSRENGEGGSRELCGESSDRDRLSVLQWHLRQQARPRRSEDRGHRLSGRPPALREVLRPLIPYKTLQIHSLVSV